MVVAWCEQLVSGLNQSKQLTTNVLRKVQTVWASPAPQGSRRETYQIVANDQT